MLHRTQFTLQSLSLDCPSVQKASITLHVYNFPLHAYNVFPLHAYNDWPSVWGKKSLKFLRQITDFGGPGRDAPRDLAESEFRSALSMGERIIEMR